MPNWIRVPAKGIRKEDLERNEELNIDIEPDSIFSPMMIDTEKITGYAPLALEDGELSPQQSEIIFDSGYWMVVNLSFETMDNLIRRPKK